MTEELQKKFKEFLKEKNINLDNNKVDRMINFSRK